MHHVIKGEHHVWWRSTGLMFSRKKNIIFDLGKDRKEGLTMWFVFFPIDAFFLDKNKKVIEMKKNFRPFTTYVPKNKARYIVEIPSPTNISVGDSVTFK